MEFCCKYQSFETDWLVRSTGAKNARMPQAIILDKNITFLRDDQDLRSHGDCTKHKKTSINLEYFQRCLITVEVYLYTCGFYCHQLYLRRNREPNLKFCMILGSFGTCTSYKIFKFQFLSQFTINFQILFHGTSSSFIKL